MGCKDETSSWHLIEFPDDSNIGSTVYSRGETHRYTVHLLIDANYANGAAAGAVSN